jgi:hypothetical protein
MVCSFAFIIVFNIIKRKWKVVMKFNKFASLGLMAVAVALNGCTPYHDYEKGYELTNGQNSVSLTLGDALSTSLYNVKEPIDVVFKAEDGYKIIVDNKEYSTYKVHINPQESINLKFNVYKDGSKKPVEIETHVNTFKDSFKPINKADLVELSGKTNQVVGEKVFYTLKQNQKETLVDLHEHNKKKKHYFYYLNANYDVRVKMIAPKYTSFVFNNGTSTREYTFIMHPGQDLNFAMDLKQDNIEETYTRNYRFIQK